MPDWNSRLEVSVNGAALVAVESVTPTYTTPVTPIHSIEADNIGALFHPQTATFTPPNGCPKAFVSTGGN